MTIINAYEHCENIFHRAEMALKCVDGLSTQLLESLSHRDLTLCFKIATGDICSDEELKRLSFIYDKLKEQRNNKSSKKGETTQ